MGSTRYITSMGELTRKDNSLCFRKNGKNVYIPIENTKEIYCLNEDHYVTLGSATQPYRPQTCPNIIFKFVLTTFCCCCSVAQSCPTLSNPMDCSTPGLPVPHYLPEFAQIYVH